MERDYELTDERIDLGRASEHTMGATGIGLDEFVRQDLPGLTDD